MSEDTEYKLTPEEFDERIAENLYSIGNLKRDVSDLDPSVHATRSGMRLIESRIDEINGHLDRIIVRLDELEHNLQQVRKETHRSIEDLRRQNASRV